MATCKFTCANYLLDINGGDASSLNLKEGFSSFFSHNCNF